MTERVSTPISKEGAREPGAAIGLAVAALAGNFLALAFTVVMARLLTSAQYGSLAALIAAFLVVSIAGSALQITVAREVAVEHSLHDAALKPHVRGWVRSSLTVVAICVAAGVLLSGSLSGLLGVGVDARWGAAAVLATGASWLLLSVVRGALQGLGGYRAVAFSIVGEAGTRLIFSSAFVLMGMGVDGAFLGSAASILAMSVVLLASLRSHLESDHEPELDPESSSAGSPAVGDFRLIALARRTWPALVALSLIALLQNTDVIMVKRAAAESVAGAYAADAVAAKVIIWIAIGLGFYVVPVSARLGEGRAARRVLARVSGLIVLAGAAMVAVYFVAGKRVLEIGFGAEYAAESKSLPPLALGMVLLAVSYLATQFFLAVGRLHFLVPLGIAVLLQIAVLSWVAATPIDAATTVLAVNAALAVSLSVLAALRSAPSRPPVVGPAPSMEASGG